MTKNKTDEECLHEVIGLLEDRVEIDTGFIMDDRGNLTHQILQLKCGEYVSVSDPEELEVVLRPATAEEQGLSLN